MPTFALTPSRTIRKLGADISASTGALQRLTNIIIVLYTASFVNGYVSSSYLLLSSRYTCPVKLSH